MKAKYRIYITLSLEEKQKGKRINVTQGRKEVAKDGSVP